MSQPGFFDFEEPIASLSKAGDPLEGLAQTVDFEKWTPLLTLVFGKILGRQAVFWLNRV